MLGQPVGSVFSNQYERSILSDISPGERLPHVCGRVLVDDEEAVAVF
jgi:hypothetical protein